MKVSVIIPFYNSEKYISETIESILNQTYNDVEIICVDNNSNDRGAVIVRELAKLNPTILLFKESAKGASFARQKGLKEAKGEIIQFLDADDIIHPDKLQAQINLLNSRNFDMIVSDRSVWNADLTKKLESLEFSKIVEIPLETAIARVIHTGNPIYKRSIVDSVEGYTPDLKVCQDWDFHLKLMRHGVKIGYLEGDFLQARNLSDSLSSNWIEVSRTLADLIFQYKPFFIEQNVINNTAVAQKIIHVYLQCLIKLKGDLKKDFWYEELTFWAKKAGGIAPFLSKKDELLYRALGLKGMVKTLTLLKK